MFALVPEGVRRKLWSISTWLVWFAGYSCLLLLGHYLLVDIFGLIEEDSVWLGFIKVVTTFLWAVIGFSFMFIVTERYEMVDKVEQGLKNNLQNIEDIYLTQQEKESTLDDQTPGHFWVLLAGDEICGMLGLAPSSQTPLYDQRPTLLPIWKQVLISLGMPLSSSLNNNINNQLKKEIIPSQPPHTATIVRWSVINEYQQCGLSSLLIHRAMTWANESGLTDVYAITSEVEMAAEQILEKRHGFKLISKKRTGWFGSYEHIWVCSVENWVEKNKNHVNSKFSRKK
ncbi:unnamed protein product [Cunninghamella blakesleeana]